MNTTTEIRGRPRDNNRSRVWGLCDLQGRALCLSYSDQGTKEHQREDTLTSPFRENCIAW